ncbi:Cell wall mannoprotein 1 [Metarhizium anisopliae]
MKFSNAVVLAAATGTYAQITVIQGVLTSVGSGIDGLNSAATGFNGDVDAVKSKADALVSAIKSGKSKVDSSSDLTLTDALGLTDPVQGLTKKGQALADNFKAKRSDVEKAGACDTVRSELKDINDNSQDLIKSVVSKVPQDAQSIASSLAAGLTKVLNQAQDDFSENIFCSHAR